MSEQVLGVTPRPLAPDFSLHDPALGMASIFRPACRGPRRRSTNVTHAFDGMTLQFTCFESLDYRDQSVLLAICALAGMMGQELTAETSNEEGLQLWLDLRPRQRALSDRALVVCCTHARLLQAAGLSDTSRAGYERLKSVLHRLSQVGCRVTQEGDDWSMQMLSFFTRADGRLFIALNGRFAAAIQGGQHIRTSLSERRLLRTEIAALVHCYLTAWVRQGGTQLVAVDKLVERIWGSEPASAATKRQRRKRMCDGLNEIAALEGWWATIEGRGVGSMVTMRRARRATRNS